MPYVSIYGFAVVGLLSLSHFTIAALDIEKFLVALEQRNISHMQFATLTPHHHHRGACHRHNKQKQNECRVLIEYRTFLIVYRLLI